MSQNPSIKFTEIMLAPKTKTLVNYKNGSSNKSRMNTFCLQLDPNGIPKGWLISIPDPGFPDDLIKQIKGREIRGIDKDTWDKFKLNYQIIKKITNETST